MTAHEHFHAGRLEDAVAAQTAEVKANANDLDARFFLFALLCFKGELERAELQLDFISHADKSLQAGSALYQSLLAAEYERRKVYREAAHPVFPPDPPAGLERRLAALHHLLAGDEKGAEQALDEANETALVSAGKLNGEAFDGVRDCDDILAGVVEIYAGGRCLWMPWERIRKLTLGEPRNPFDLLWAKAELEDADGSQATVYLPATYEGSWEQPEEAVRVGRTTEWIEWGDGLFRGAGQRILLSASGEQERETPILTLRTLEIEGPSAES